MKNILIIGASGDIGGVITRNLAEVGNQLILHFHQNKQSMQAIVDDLQKEQVLQVIQADLTQEEGIEKLCRTVNYHVDVIVFVSGMQQIGLFQDTTDETMTEMLNLNVKAPWKITKHFLPEMLQLQAGHIIFITSIWGEVGASHEVVYSSVKGAQNSFVKALAKEVGPSGIRVNAISPGLIDTKMNQQLLDEEKALIITEIPLQRIGLASDVANAVDFLMDDKSNYIHGEIIRISGGW